jgi:hypothetical protein
LRSDDCTNSRPNERTEPLLRHNLLEAASAEVTTGVFLVGAYLPNATFSLVIFFPETLFTSWSTGAYFVLAACIGYSLRIIELMP